MHHHPDYMTCLEAAHALDDYLHDELDPEKQKQVNDHLRLCEECVRHYRFEKALVTLIREKARACTAPPDLRSRLRRMLEDA
jgi:anti-sigma factor (TIGR02949 family)